MFLMIRWVVKRMNVLKQADAVLVNGISVEKVKLHLANNLAPLRQISGHDAKPVHQTKCFVQCIWVSAQSDEFFTRSGDGMQELVQAAASSSQLT
jgi:hypothetical protein